MRYKREREEFCHAEIYWKFIQREYSDLPIAFDAVPTAEAFASFYLLDVLCGILI